MRLKVISTHLGVVNILDYGADPTGVADSTTAIQAAVTAAGTYGCVFIPEGVFRTTNTVTIPTSGGFQLVGVGTYSSTIRFAPSANNLTCIKFERSAGYGGPNPIGNTAVSSLRIDSTDTIYNKIALEFVDGVETSVSDLLITNWHGNTDSIGIKTKGREAFWCNNVNIQATIPVMIGLNPNEADGWLAADHFTFTNMQLVIASGNIPATLPSACVYIEDGAHVSQLQFEGSQAWVGGRYGLYWNQTVAPSGYSSGVSLKNVRTEGGATPASYWSVYMNVGTFAGGKELRNLSIENCEFEAARKGIYLRNVLHTSISDCMLMQTGAGLPILDVDDAHSVTLKGLNTITTATVADQLVIGAKLIPAGGVPHINGYALPHSFTWIYNSIDSNYNERPRYGMNNAEFWEWAGTIADDGTVQLPVSNANNWEHATVEVLATIEASNIIEYGVWHTAPVTGLTNGVVKASGSTNTASSNVDTNLCVYCGGGSPMTAPVYVQNRLGATAYVTIKVSGIRSVTT